jgi:c-di-AMP phosphodiesterase-like protein
MHGDVIKVKRVRNKVLRIFLTQLSIIGVVVTFKGSDCQSTQDQYRYLSKKTPNAKRVTVIKRFIGVLGLAHS